MRRMLSFFMTLVLLLSMIPMSAHAAKESGMDNFRKSGTYVAGQFRDVPEKEWYRNGIASAYELGLMKGSNAEGTTFSPMGNIDLAAVVTIAARIHSIYTTGKDEFVQGSPWYQVYVDCAVEHGILTAGEFTNFNATATRGQVAHIIAAALPQKELGTINQINTLPDVDHSTPYSSEIFQLYRAGVLTGNDDIGTYTPNAPINRAAIATIITRVALPETRRILHLKNDNLAVDSNGAIQPLGMVRAMKDIPAVDGVEAYEDYWFNWDPVAKADLSDSLALANSLTFSDATQWPDEDKLPTGFDPEGLLEWGKYPGLNVDILHKHGFTGKGAVIAYVDQPFSAHEQYDDATVHYVNNDQDRQSMHGPAVLSLLAGKGIGTAPDAEIYYYASRRAFIDGEFDQTVLAEDLYQIIEQNKALPQDEKITMVGFSNNIVEHRPNAQALRDAVSACNDAGIMVWFCGEYQSGSFLQFSDKNNYENLVPDYRYGMAGSPKLHVPASGRTTAATMGGAKYIYWSNGGLSWTMPFVLGLYAIAGEIDPTLTEQEMRALLNSTADQANNIKIVNPVGFIAAVLDRVGRGAEGQEMLREVAARKNYIYAILDTASMSEADLNSVGSYLASITDATVLVVDASSFSNAQQIYSALQADAAARGGNVAGVQIFGTPDMVPAFSVKYRVQMKDEVEEGGVFLTDLFYGNLENDVAMIGPDYNVLDHFAEEWDVDLVPQWPVARLPLSKGEFTAFFEKYDQFVTDTGLEQPDLVNFSNPIFRQKKHTDDMGTFLNRAAKEFKILDVPYRLYGNQDGQYPVTTKVLGNFTADNLAVENQKSIVEFLVNTHGQRDNIDRCIYVNDEEQRISLVNMDTINTVLNGNPYYLDCWTCQNGTDMANNLTTTALNGHSVGMFSATTVISNNGVDCYADLSEMPQSNFYYFYYNYLKALSEGASRSKAFCAAQQAYGAALMAEGEEPINFYANYQFNLCNLLAYHNFGVLEPNAGQNFEAKGYITQAGQSVPKDVVAVKPGQGGGSSAANFVLSEGNPVGEPRVIRDGQSDQLQDKNSVVIHSYQCQKLDNGYLRFTLEFTAPVGMRVNAFSPPDGDLFMYSGLRTTGERQSVTYDIPITDVEKSGTVTVGISSGDNNRLFVFYRHWN